MKFVAVTVYKQKTAPFAECGFTSVGNISQLAPEIIIAPSPEIKKANMKPSSISTLRGAPLNSFQTKIPHSAATIGAPCPSA